MNHSRFCHKFKPTASFGDHKIISPRAQIFLSDESNIYFFPLYLLVFFQGVRDPGRGREGYWEVWLFLQFRNSENIEGRSQNGVRCYYECTQIVWEVRVSIYSAWPETDRLNVSAGRRSVFFFPKRSFICWFEMLIYVALPSII